MHAPLRVLIVEDVEEDALLVVRELQRGGFVVDFERVDTREAMASALAERAPWDLVLSDYSMPRFSAPMALGLIKERNLDVPFIIVSGTVSEDIAVEALRAGAHDFMAKGKLGRLIPAVERELRDAQVRTEQRKLQDQLMIADRMASVGVLAAGVAHEINNPLACVMANLDLAVRELGVRTAKLGLEPEFDEVREELRDARDAAERIRNIVRDLKIFSRARDEKTAPVDVTAVMESTLRMAWNEIRHRARLVRNYSETPAVEVNESRLGQVFLNLVINAAQAIAEGNAEANEIRVSTRLAVDGSVVTEVTDTGPGMSAEILAQLFTPFFTTKPIGEGTGLGLSICHRIVSEYRGTIEVVSDVDVGTTVRVNLPPANTARVESQSPIAREAVSARRGRILVIDDEPMIGRVVQRMLADDHDVVAVEGAQEALRRIVSGEHFDVILCDLMMPEMTGKELHAALLERGDAQAERMIFLTGGAFTLAARAFLDEVPNLTVEKPFHAHHLRAVVSEAIR